MKAALHVALVVLVALSSVAVGEAAMFAWLASAPLDVTGHLFWYGILPVQVCVVGFATLVLLRLYRQRFALLAGLYVAVHLAAYTALLNQLLNPIADIAAYWAALAVSYALWLGVAYRASTRRVA